MDKCLSVVTFNWYTARIWVLWEVKLSCDWQNNFLMILGHINSVMG